MDTQTLERPTPATAEASDTPGLSFDLIKALVDDTAAEVNALEAQYADYQRRAAEARRHAVFIRERVARAIPFLLTDNARFHRVMAEQIWDGVLLEHTGLWSERQMTDAEITAQLLHLASEDACNTSTVGWSAVGPLPMFRGPGDVPKLIGAEAVRAVRRVLGIPYPKDEPTTPAKPEGADDGNRAAHDPAAGGDPAGDAGPQDGARDAQGGLPDRGGTRAGGPAGGDAPADGAAGRAGDDRAGGDGRREGAGLRPARRVPTPGAQGRHERRKGRGDGDTLPRTAPTPGAIAQRERAWPAWRGSAKSTLKDEYTPEAELFLRLMFDNGERPGDACRRWRAERETIRQRQADPAPEEVGHE